MPGRSGCRFVGARSWDELQIELNRGLANSFDKVFLSVTRQQHCAWPLQVLRLAIGLIRQAKRVMYQFVSIQQTVSADNIETLPIAVTGTDKMVPLEQIADISMGKGPARIEHADGKTHDRSFRQTFKVVRLVR